jgi:hypothetical protein
MERWIANADPAESFVATLATNEVPVHEHAEFCTPGALPAGRRPIQQQIQL